MTNDFEYFAELTMWYFGGRGDHGKISPVPLAGREWLKSYDPNVTLRGNVEDWTKVAKKVRALEQFGNLGWWLNDLHPIMDQLVATAAGKIDVNFWDALYKAKIAAVEST